MKLIAIPTRDERVDDHFGHCDHYTVFTIDDDKSILKKERLDSPQGCGCKSNIAEKMEQMGITLMLAGNMGDGAYNKLSSHHIDVIRGCSGTIDDVLESFLNDCLLDSGNACNHHDCHDSENKEETPVFKISISDLK